MKKSTLMWSVGAIIAFSNLSAIMFAGDTVSLFKSMIFVAAFVIANIWFIGAFIVEQMERNNG